MRIAKVLGVHPQSISIAIQRRKIINDVGDVLWSFSIKRRRNNGCTTTTKITNLALWASKIQVNPNKVDMTTKRLKVGIWDEEPTHYLMET
jgi:hypothetical protein